MNTYEIRVNNAVMTSTASNEWSAMDDLCIFSHIGDMVDFVRTLEDSTRNTAWIYKVRLNGEWTLAYVKRIS